MHTHSERGIALVLALFLMTALSVLGASLMFLSQTETYASMNYRMMSQARYAAEAGVNKGANFLLDGTQYTVPTVVGGADPLANYITTSSPVTYNGLAGDTDRRRVHRRDRELSGRRREGRLQRRGAGDSRRRHVDADLQDVRHADLDAEVRLVWRHDGRRADVGDHERRWILRRVQSDRPCHGVG